MTVSPSTSSSGHSPPLPPLGRSLYPCLLWHYQLDLTSQFVDRETISITDHNARYASKSFQRHSFGLSHTLYSSGYTCPEGIQVLASQMFPVILSIVKPKRIILYTLVFSRYSPSSIVYRVSPDQAHSIPLSTLSNADSNDRKYIRSALTYTK